MMPRKRRRSNRARKARSALTVYRIVAMNSQINIIIANWANQATRLTDTQKQPRRDGAEDGNRKHEH